jgi:hypothetical protein
MNTIHKNPLLQELDQRECSQIKGGLGWLIPILVGGIVYQVLSHWDQFKEGLTGKPETPE